MDIQNAPKNVFQRTDFLPNLFSPLKPKAKTYLPYSPLHSKRTHLANVISHYRKHKCICPWILLLFSLTLPRHRSAHSDAEEFKNVPNSLLSVVLLIINNFLKIISFFPRNCWLVCPVIKLPNAEPKSEKLVVSPLQLAAESSRARESRDWLPKVWRRGAPRLHCRHLSLLLANEFSHGELAWAQFLGGELLGRQRERSCQAHLTLGWFT